MAKKTNCTKNGYGYYRIVRKINGKRQEFLGSCKKDAEEKYEAAKAQAALGLRADYKKMTLGELMRIWVYDVIVPSKRADGTKAKHEGAYRVHIKESDISKVKINDITGLDIQRFYSSKIDSGKSANTVKEINKTLKMFFGYAVEQKFVASNPCKGIELPEDNKEWSEDEQENIIPFSDEDLKDIWTAVREHKEAYGHDMEFTVQLALGTGLREGEQFALTEKDFDLDEGVIKITKALKKSRIIKRDGSHEYKLMLGPPKTKSSRREVPIPDSLVVPLQRYIVQQKKKYMRNGLKYTSKSPLFTTESCNYIDPRNLIRSWGRILGRTDVEYRCWHYLRHTYATKLFEAGVDIKTVSGLLGHSSIKETESVYVHLLPKKKINEVNKLNYLFK